MRHMRCTFYIFKYSHSTSIKYIIILYIQVASIRLPKVQCFKLGFFIVYSYFAILVLFCFFGFFFNIQISILQRFFLVEVLYESLRK